MLDAQEGNHHMKASQPPIERDPKKVAELAAENKRFGGTGWSAGTMHTSDGDDQRYMVDGRGSFRRVKLVPNDKGNFDIALQRKLTIVSGRQRKKLNKELRRRAKHGSSATSDQETNVSS
jgi:hypothetical protein